MYPQKTRRLGGGMRKYRKKYAKKKWVREIKNVDTDTGSTTERERGGRGWLILLLFEVLRKIRKHKCLYRLAVSKRLERMCSRLG